MWPRSCSICSPTPRPSAIVVHSVFTPTLAEVLPQLPNLRVILQVPDDSGNPLLPGAVWYEDALAVGVARAARRRVEPRRPLHALHRRHDGDAQGCHVAQRRCHGRVLRRIQDRGDRRRLRHRGDRWAPGAARSPVHARRRPLDELPCLAQRWHGLRPIGPGAARSGRHLVDDRSGEDQLPAHRRRRVRPSVAR